MNHKKLNSLLTGLHFNYSCCLISQPSYIQKIFLIEKQMKNQLKKFKDIVCEDSFIKTYRISVNPSSWRVNVLELNSTIDRYYQYQTLYLRCLLGDKETQASSTLTEVKTSTKNEVRGYSCSKCGNAYSRPHSLSRHIRFECGVEPQFECPICHKRSKHKHNLLLHMRTHRRS